MVKNLNNPEYLKIILSGKSSLATRFAEIDSERIRSAMKNCQIQEEKLSAAVKKLIKIQELPQQMLNSVGKQNYGAYVAC